MSTIKFSKQMRQPNHKEVDYWVDYNSDPYGSRIKYYNGADWVDLINTNGDSMNLGNYFNKSQINSMLIDKASSDSVNLKADKSEINELIKNIEIQELDNGIALVIFKYDGTNVAVSLPIADSTSSGIVTSDDFKKFVKQHELQQLYSEMYDKLSEIRSQYQKKLKAGKNITIDSNNVISAALDVDKLSGIYTIKGSSTFEDLPEDNIIGDVYNITNDFVLNDVEYSSGTNIVYTEDGWDALSGIFDTSSLEEQIKTISEQLPTKISELENDSNFITISDITYTWTYVSKFSSVATAISVVSKLNSKQIRKIKYNDITYDVLHVSGVSTPCAVYCSNGEGLLKFDLTAGTNSVTEITYATNNSMDTLKPYVIDGNSNPSDVYDYLSSEEAKINDIYLVDWYDGSSTWFSGKVFYWYQKGPIYHLEMIGDASNYGGWYQGIIYDVTVTETNIFIDNSPVVTTFESQLFTNISQNFGVPGVEFLSSSGKEIFYGEYKKLNITKDTVFTLYSSTDNMQFYRDITLEYQGEFTFGDTVYNVTFPEEVKWSTDSVLEYKANHTYQFRILNNLGVMKEFAN